MSYILVVHQEKEAVNSENAVLEYNCNGDVIVFGSYLGAVTYAKESNLKDYQVYQKADNDQLQKQKKKTVLVRYKEYQNSAHALLDDAGWIEKGKIIKVNDLIELNDEFKNIIDVKILE